jgi:hypothetical protein
MRHRDRTAVLIQRVQQGEGGPPVTVDGFELRDAERASDVPLAERTARARCEDEVLAVDERRSASMFAEESRQLLGDRNGPRRPIGFGRAEVPVSVDLVGELDLGVRYGSSAASIVCSSSPRSKTRRRFPFDGFGRSEESISDTGFRLAHPRRRAAYR